jgi:hypothetical protein
MRLNSAIFSLVIAVVTISIGSTAAISQDKPSKWIDFGKVGTGERLQLDVNNVFRTRMPIDDRTNLEGMTDEDIQTAKIPMRGVISFNYKIDGRLRRAYTNSCKNKNLTANPSWRTSTTFIDYWPQYFSVPADSLSSRQMLKNVCILGVSK